MNWVVDPAPPASRRPVLEASSAPTMLPSGDVPQPPRRQKSRRRRRRKAACPANQLPASRQNDVTAQAGPTANDNSARWRATRPRSASTDRPEMRSTPVKHPHSFTSPPLSQLSIPAANQNAERVSRRDHSEIWGLYKPAQTDPTTRRPTIQIRPPQQAPRNHVTFNQIENMVKDYTIQVLSGYNWISYSETTNNLHEVVNNFIRSVW